MSDKPTTSRPSEQALTLQGGQYVEIPIDQLLPSSLNKFAMENIESLATNIAQTGLLSPLKVIDVLDNKYEILSGARRYHAISMLHEKNASLFSTIPCIIIAPSDLTIDDMKGLVIQISNLQAKADYNVDLHRMQAISMLNRFYRNDSSKRPDIIKILKECFGITDRYARMYLRISKDGIPELQNAVVAKKSDNTAIANESSISANDITDSAEPKNSSDKNTDSPETEKQRKPLGHIPVARASRIAKQSQEKQAQILKMMQDKGVSVEEAIDAIIDIKKHPPNSLKEAKTVRTWAQAIMKVDITTLGVEQRDALQSILSLADYIREQGLEENLADLGKNNNADVDSETNIGKEDNAD